MKFITLAIFLISTSLYANSDMARKICDTDQGTATLLNNWKKESATKYCAEVRCVNASDSFNRIRCFAKRDHMGENKLVIITTDLRSASMKSRGEMLTINAQEPCFDFCKPEKGMLKIKKGLERESCVECLKERSLTYKEPVFIDYPEIGKPLEKNTKCYYQCVDKDGPIQKERILSPECISCVGLNGIAPEKFEYLQTKSGKCFEVDKDKRILSIDKISCQKAGNDLLLTYYNSVKTFSEWIFNQPSTCYELDEATGGLMFKEMTKASHCEFSSIDDSDRNIVNDKENTERPSQKKSSATKQ